MILTESEIDSLSRFMRAESPLASFARSLRMEEVKQTTSTDADPFAGIDWDNLPDDLKETLTKAKENVATLQQGAKDLAVEKAKSDKLAKDHQARADRNYEKLKQHNLEKDTGSPTATGDDAVLAEMSKEIVNLVPGLTSEQALAQAKIQLAMGRKFQQATYQGLNPALGAVADMHANRLLSDAILSRNDSEGVFQIPEVMDSVKLGLQQLVQQGTTVTPETIVSLRNMAFGNHVLTLKPEERTKFMEQKSTGFSTGGSTFGGQNSSVATLQQREGSGKPVAANAETAAAIAQTMEHMKKGFQLKDGKGKK